MYVGLSNYLWDRLKILITMNAVTVVVLDILVHALPESSFESRFLHDDRVTSLWSFSFFFLFSFFGVVELECSDAFQNVATCIELV